MAFSDTRFDVKNYTDIQGLVSLKGQIKQNNGKAQHEVAQQFESLLVQILLKSMRDANKALSNGEGADEQSELYQDLFDKQISLAISGKGVGLAEKIEQYINHEPNLKEKKPVTELTELKRLDDVKKLPEPATQTVSRSDPAAFDNQADFIKHLFPVAKTAAKLLNLDPKIMLAQAALETNWGKKIIAGVNSLSSHNLFNIKADSNWQKKTASAHTIEQEGDVLVKTKATFRAYDSFTESFQDYVHFLQNNPRYQEALKAGHDPKEYIGLLQKAHYATDNQYADKIMSIYNSKSFKQMCAEH